MLSISIEDWISMGELELFRGHLNMVQWGEGRTEGGREGRAPRALGTRGPQIPATYVYAAAGGNAIRESRRRILCTARLGRNKTKRYD
jgi:hypothetical protein